MGRAEDMKKAIEEKLTARDAEGEMPETGRDWTFDEIIKDVEADDIEIPEDESVTDFFPYEEEGVIDVTAIEDAIRLAGESGYEAFRNGVADGENPFETDEDITEALEEEEVMVLAEAWTSGWVQANHDFWMSQVVLTGKELVECATAEDAQDALQRLEYATGMLGQTLDYDDYRAFWTV